MKASSNWQSATVLFGPQNSMHPASTRTTHGTPMHVLQTSCSANQLQSSCFVAKWLCIILTQIVSLIKIIKSGLVRSVLNSVAHLGRLICVLVACIKFSAGILEAFLSLMWCSDVSLLHMWCPLSKAKGRGDIFALLGILPVPPPLLAYFFWLLELLK